MSVPASRFAHLLNLAREPSSEKRRELLRDVTDLFFASEPSRSERETALFDQILHSIAQELPAGSLKELAARFADTAAPPVQLVQHLAHQDFAIAEPLLKRSRALSDEDLIAIVQARSQQHIRAVAERQEVSAPVSDAIVDKGDDVALDTLVRNEGARLSRSALEAVVDRARANPALHAGIVGRRDMPLDLLNEMYFEVEAKLRKAILERNASVDPAELDAALSRARDRLKAAAVAASEEMRLAERRVTLMAKCGELDGKSLLAFHRAGQTHHFFYGLAELTGVDYDTAHRIIEGRDLDALAMICRAAGLERPLFVTLAVLCMGGEAAMARAEEYGRLYSAVPVEAAQRAMRFYRLRKGGPEKLKLQPASAAGSARSTPS